MEIIPNFEEERGQDSKISKSGEVKQSFSMKTKGQMLFNFNV